MKAERKEGSEYMRQEIDRIRHEGHIKRGEIVLDCPYCKKFYEVHLKRYGRGRGLHRLKFTC
jgi:hypothetical protein